MLGLLPLWVLLTWMVFPILAMAAESTLSVGKLHPWPSTDAISAPGCEGELCSWERPAWRGDRPFPGRILFVSVGFYGHAMPLLSLAEEMAERGHNVTFGTHNRLRPVVDETPGVSFLSAGRMPMHDHHLRGKLRSLSRAGGFWGLLTLLNDVYLPLARPMYRALLSAVQLSPPPPPVGRTAVGEMPESGIPGELDPGANRCAGSGGGGGGGGGGAVLAEGSACDSSSVGREGALAGGARGGGVPGAGAGGHGTWGSGEEEAEAEAEAAVCGASDSSWARPFDLVVLDMGSLGGLDFAQKLGIPYMFNSPSLLFDLSGRHVTATLPGWGTGMGRRMSLGDRLQNAISPRALSVFLTPAFIAMNKARREQGLEPFHAQDNVFHGARILVNTAFGVEYPHSLAPLVELTGPLLPPRVARALSSPLPPPPPPPPPPSPGSPLPPTRGKHARSEEKRPGTVGPATDSPPGGGTGGAGGIDGEEEEEDPLALPFMIRTWLGGTGALVAPGTAAFEAAVKQAATAKQRAEAAAEGGQGLSPAAAAAAAAADGTPPLPDDKGVIYVNLGRMPQLEAWQLAKVLQSLWPSSDSRWEGEEDRLGRYRILCVLPREQRELVLSELSSDSPKSMQPSLRLKFLGGLPLLGILAHPAVKAVVSHCGMGSAQEALLFGKPLLCLPMLADQEDVARRVMDAGAGLGLSGLPTGNISSGDIRDAVADLVSDTSSFRSSAGVLSGVLRRAGGTVRAADVVEGTLQLGGSSHLHPPDIRGPWQQTSSTDAYTFLVASVIVLAVLGYALLAAACYGTLLVLRAAARAVARAARWFLGLRRHVPCIRWWGGEASRPNGGGNGSAATVLSSSKTAALVAVAGYGSGGGGLWDEALMAFLGGPGPPDPFPEDSLPELDGPAIDRQPAPGPGGRNGGSGGGGGGNGGVRGGAGGGGVGGHLRSLSGELVTWPEAPNDSRTFDIRGWSNGGGGYNNGSDVSPHLMKRWD